MSRIFVWPKGRKLVTRKVTNGLAIHCTATPEGRNVDATDVDAMHRAKGWEGIGYHYIVHLDGSIEAGRPENCVGSHIEGRNHDLLGIVYAGGLDVHGKAKDTRTPDQKDGLAHLVKSLNAKYKLKSIGGHRDYSPDKNHDGIIESYEWLKDCPCFDVKSWLKTIQL